MMCKETWSCVARMGLGNYGREGGDTKEDFTVQKHFWWSKIYLFSDPLEIFDSTHDVFGDESVYLLWIWVVVGGFETAPPSLNQANWPVLGWVVVQVVHLWYVHNQGTPVKHCVKCWISVVKQGGKLLWESRFTTSRISRQCRKLAAMVRNGFVKQQFTPVTTKSLCMGWLLWMWGGDEEERKRQTSSKKKFAEVKWAYKLLKHGCIRSQKWYFLSCCILKDFWGLPSPVWPTSYLYFYCHIFYIYNIFLKDNV